jgi:hypothetical protein
LEEGAEDLTWGRDLDLGAKARASVGREYMCSQGDPSPEGDGEQRD